MKLMQVDLPDMLLADGDLVVSKTEPKATSKCELIESSDMWLLAPSRMAKVITTDVNRFTDRVFDDLGITALLSLI